MCRYIFSFMSDVYVLSFYHSFALKETERQNCKKDKERNEREDCRERLGAGLVINRYAKPTISF